MNAIYKLMLDLNRSGVHEVVRVRLHDTMRELHMYLNEGSESYHISGGVRAVLCAKKPDGIVIFNSCEIAGDKVIYRFTGQETAVAGVTECELRLYDGDRVISSARFEILVDGTAVDDEEVLSLPEATELTRLMHHSEEVLERLDGIHPVSYEEQTLTWQQAAQARKNIMAVGQQDFDELRQAVEEGFSDVVRTSPQSFTEDEKTQARGNIGAVSNEDFEGYRGWVEDNVVKYGGEQDLTEDEKAQARANIGTMSVAEIQDGIEDAINDSCVKLVEQDISDRSKEQARQNINAADAAAVDEVKVTVYGGSDITDVTGQILEGTTINADTGKEGHSLPYATATGMIAIDHDAQYLYSGTILNFVGIAGYDASGEYVAPILRGDSEKRILEDVPLRIPEAIAYIRASSYASSESTKVPVQINRIGAVTGLTENVEDLNGRTDDLANDVSDLTGRVEELEKRERPESEATVHLYVSPSGSDETGDGSAERPFATIFQADASITDASEEKPYIVHVADGVYTDFQERYQDTRPTGYEGIVCKDHVSYVGNIENPAACKIVWDGAYGYDKSIYNYADIGVRKCIFHIIGERKTAVKGFCLEAKNTRYCLHIETTGKGRGAEWEVSDCIFLWHGQRDCIDRTTHTSCIGTGCGLFEKGHLVRCRIVNDEDVHGGWMNHDSRNFYPNAAFAEGAEIIIESCDFGGTDVCFRNINGDDVVKGYDRFSIINCVGINKLYYQLVGTTACMWRAKVECSEISNNVFAAQGLLQ